MEQLLACAPPWDDLASQLHGEAGIGDIATLNVETIKLRHIGVESGVAVATAADDSDSLPIPVFSSSSPPALSGTTVEVDDSAELTVEQLLALAELHGEPAEGVRGGADAWERVVGDTVKRVESDVEGKKSKAWIMKAPGATESRRGKGSLSFAAKKEAERGRRLGEVFLPTGVEVAQEPSPPPPSHPTPASPVASTRMLKLEQEMAETREMVRALSARVSGVEARIGEMERVAGELEVRRRRLVVGEEKARKELGGADSGSAWRARWLASVTGACRLLSSSATPGSRPGIPLWYKRSWTRYLLVLGLGACAFLLREAVRRGIMRGRVMPALG